MWKITGKCLFLMLFRKRSGNVFPQELTGWKFTDFPTVVPKSIICRCSSSTNCGGVSVSTLRICDQKNCNTWTHWWIVKTPCRPWYSKHIWGNWFHNSQTSIASNMENLFPNMIPMGLRYCPLKHQSFLSKSKKKKDAQHFCFEWCSSQPFPLKKTLDIQKTGNKKKHKRPWVPPTWSERTAVISRKGPNGWEPWPHDFNLFFRCKCLLPSFFDKKIIYIYVYYIYNIYGFFKDPVVQVILVTVELLRTQWFIWCLVLFFRCVLAYFLWY